MRKTVLLVVMVFLTLTAVCLAQEQEKGLKCTEDCDWYVWDFQNIAKSLKKSLDSPGKIANYNLDQLLVDSEIKLKCAKKACAGDKKKLYQTERAYGDITGLIRSGLLKSPSPITDNFSGLLKDR